MVTHMTQMILFGVHCVLGNAAMYIVLDLFHSSAVVGLVLAGMAALGYSGTSCC